MGDSVDLEQLLRRAEFLFLASRDFWDVGIGVDYLTKHGDPDGSPTRENILFQTGLLVTYCRPFTGSSGRQIGPDPGLSQELRTFHDDLMDRRNKAYAHSDHTDYRTIRDLRSDAALEVLHNFESATVREEWDTLTTKGLAWLRELAAIHNRRVTAELQRIRDRLEVSDDAGSH